MGCAHLLVLGVIATCFTQAIGDNSGRKIEIRSTAAQEVRVDFDRLVHISRGIDRSKLAEIIGSDPRHELTCKRDGKVYEVGSYRMGPSYAAYYVVFIDKKLARIIDAPPLRVEIIVQEDGSHLEKMITEDVDEHLDRVLMAPDLDVESFSTSLTRRVIGGEKLPANDIMALLASDAELTSHLRQLEAQQRQQSVVNAELLERFNGWHVRLAEEHKVVDRVLGECEKLPVDGSELERCVYDPKAALDLVDKRIRVSPVLVEYHSGLVLRVMSEHFLPVRGD